ncbi:MAG: T9SS type A sorting domain-containing protein [Chitinophagales bacterium]
MKPLFPYKKLAGYSIFATAFLSTKSSESQIVYTDIDDVTLSADNEFYNIDFDYDGLYDFKLQKISGSFYSYWSDHISYADYIFISPLQSGNKIAGLKSVINPSYGGFTQYFPFALNSFALINEDLTFQNNNFEILAYKIRNDVGGGGPSGGEWFYNNVDQYLGVMFVDTLDCKHYGWIRCEAFGGADSIVIKDFAYVISCEIGVYAGTNLIETDDIAINSLQNFKPTIYNYRNILTININANLVGSNYTITSADGKLIGSGNLNQPNNTINLTCAPGIFIVTVKNAISSYAQKIIVI